MLHDAPRGRHRAAARHPLKSELSTILGSAGRTGAKVAAVLTASGGLVVAVSVPAQATDARTAADSSVVSAPAARLPVRGEPVAPALAPAVVAPPAVAPVALDRVGVVGLKVVPKPKPKPKPRPRPVPASPVEGADVGGLHRAQAEPAAEPDPPRTSRSTAASTSRPSRTAVRQSSNDVVTIARTLLGIPYVYGGESPSGFDCSGLTMYVFGKAGVSIPRTASAQQSAATPVDDPRPGDLVFFGSPAWHVGIYTGSGMMIDSPREGKSTSERPIFSGVSGYGRF